MTFVKKNIFAFVLLGIASLSPVCAQAAGLDLPISSGDTAWVLISAGLVLLMTPALAFFYGGLVR